MPDSPNSLISTSKIGGSRANQWLFSTEFELGRSHLLRTLESTDKPRGGRGRGRRTSGLVFSSTQIAVSPQEIELEVADPPKPRRGTPPILYKANPEELDHRHAHWWEDRVEIIAAMKEAGVSESQIFRFEQCGARAWVEVDPSTDKLRLRAQYCHNRHCLPCGQARVLLVADNIVAKMDNDDQYLHIVLTTRHEKLPLSDQLTRLLKWWKALRNRPLWKNAVDGGVGFLQMHRAQPTACGTSTCIASGGAAGSTPANSPTNGNA